jgi:hypothetical protein
MTEAIYPVDEALVSLSAPELLALIQVSHAELVKAKQGNTIDGPLACMDDMCLRLAREHDATELEDCRRMFGYTMRKLVRAPPEPVDKEIDEAIGEAKRIHAALSVFAKEEQDPRIANHIMFALANCTYFVSFLSFAHPADSPRRATQVLATIRTQFDIKQ